MRPLTLAGALLALAACFGAVIVGRNGQDPTEPDGALTGTSGAQDEEIRAQQPIDKRQTIQLTAVRAPVDTGQNALGHVERLVSFGPRYSAKEEGRPGWTKQLAYIEQEIARLGLELKKDTWTDRKELITFTNVSVVIPGKRKERILIGCHHDTKCTSGHPQKEHNFDFVGANDGGSGVGLLLALAPLLQQTPREATIELVFFDGEESLDWKWHKGKRALFGSKRYVKRYLDARALGEMAEQPASRIEAMILLDMVGRDELHIQDETYSTTKLRQILYSAATACGHQQHFFIRSEAASDDHYPFLQQGIPAVDLIDLNGNPYWHTPLDTLKYMSAASLQKVADVVLTMLPEVERSYLQGPR